MFKREYFITAVYNKKKKKLLPTKNYEFILVGSDF